jgi:hypothetical protein
MSSRSVLATSLCSPSVLRKILALEADPRRPRGAIFNATEYQQCEICHDSAAQPPFRRRKRLKFEPTEIGSGSFIDIKSLPGVISVALTISRRVAR